MSTIEGWDIASGRSFMNIKKSIGANTEPWGTPWVRYWDEDSTLLMEVRCLRDVRYEVINVLQAYAFQTVNMQFIN